MYKTITFLAFAYLISISCQSGTGGESCSDGILGDTEYTIDCGGNCPLCEEFFEGAWVSEDENLSTVWKELFSAQKITVTFASDKTFSLQILTTGGQTIPAQGSYTLADAGIDGIWNITLNQTQPDAKVYEGILKAQDNYVLNVEIVQTDPYINAIPPTASGGLGSTMSETGGNTVPIAGNVHTFIRQ